MKGGKADRKQAEIIMILLSSLARDIRKFIETGDNLEELRDTIRKGSRRNEGIKEDIANWRLDVMGYNPVADTGGVSWTDLTLDKSMRILGIRKPFSSKQVTLLSELKQSGYSEPMIAFFFKKSLQEIRIELKKLD